MVFPLFTEERRVKSILDPTTTSKYRKSLKKRIHTKDKTTRTLLGTTNYNKTTITSRKMRLAFEKSSVKKLGFTAFVIFFLN